MKKFLMSWKGETTLGHIELFIFSLKATTIHSFFFLSSKVWGERVVANGNHDLGSRTSNQVSYPLFLLPRFRWLPRSLNSARKTPLLSVSYIPF